MYIKNLKLKNYRNYEDLDVNFDRNINVIFGDNAQGKTNILESIFLCSSGKSHRTHKFFELIQAGKKTNSIILNFTKNKKDIQIKMEFDENEKRNIKVNDIKIKKIGNLMGNLIVIFFSPDELKIIKGSPTDRRRFIDITISQFRPKYFYALQQYNKVITQRNILLKQIFEKKEGMDILDVWDKQLISIGSYIIKSRIDFIKELNIVSNKKHLALTDSLENLEITYEPSFIFSLDLSIDKIKKEFQKKIKLYKNTDIKRGITSVGPQRDDFSIKINNKDIKLYGSQGQQRTAVLSMKLAKIDIIYEDTGVYPVLLLDDVFSELDKKRQQSLLETLKKVQTFITCTNKDIDILNTYSNIKFIEVRNGNVVK